MYVLIRNGAVEKYQYSVGELRKDNPQTSFPRNPSDELLQKWNVFPVKYVNPPQYNQVTQTVKEGLPVFENDEWVQTWIIEEVPQDEINRRTENQAQAVRMERNQKLSDTDWVVAFSYEKEEPIPDEWKQYRQELRDIPTQEGFPFEVVWPELP